MKRPARERGSGDRRSGDSGYSLVEVLVAMGVTTIIGVVFTTATLQIFRTATAEDNDYLTQQQISLALQRLERQLPYAYSIGAVHTEGTAAAPYVEYLLRTPAVAQTAYLKQCFQIRLTGTDPARQLQSRYWTQGVPAGVTAWTVLASNLSTSGTVPFTRTQPTALVNHQLLTVRVASQSGSALQSSAITFTALNTYSGTALDSSGNSLAASAEPCYDTSLRS